MVLDGYTCLSGVKIYPGQNDHWLVNNGHGMQKGWKNYFVAYFDQPFVAYGTWENENNTIQHGADHAEGKGRGAFVQFKEGVKVQVKVASSYISEVQAQLNLKRELGNDATLEVTKSKAEKFGIKFGKNTGRGRFKDDKATFIPVFSGPVFFQEHL